VGSSHKATRQGGVEEVDGEIRTGIASHYECDGLEGRALEL